MPLRVTVWHEFRHEKSSAAVGKVYPDGIHAAIKAGLDEHLGRDADVRIAALDDPEQGLTDEVIANTDVMLWWGHAFHGEVDDARVSKVVERVRAGMGFICLHSGHYAKPFKQLLGTHCHLKWRDNGERERLWVVSPGHPITAGLKSDHILLEHEEMYGEHFDVPEPDELIFVSWFEGGEVFRSGCVWRRGAGRIFYFRPGHEIFPTYFHPEVRQVIANAVRYVAPVAGVVPYRNGSPNALPSMEPIKNPTKPLSELHGSHQK